MYHFHMKRFITMRMRPFFDSPPVSSRTALPFPFSTIEEPSCTGASGFMHSAWSTETSPFLTASAAFPRDNLNAEDTTLSSLTELTLSLMYSVRASGTITSSTAAATVFTSTEPIRCSSSRRNPSIPGTIKISAPSGLTSISPVSLRSMPSPRIEPR